MVAQMQKIVSTMSGSSPELSVEERNLLSIAYKNVIGSHRASWRVISSIEQREESKGSSDHASIAKEYRLKIEKELSDLCRDILNTLEKHLVPSAASSQSKAFYLKMCGDYCRYLAEFRTPEEQKEPASQSLDAYTKASAIACTDLPSTDPLRLGLALNFSVFHFEIMNDRTKACSLAKEAFDSAIEELDSLSEEEYKDSTVIMQLLRDNLALWTSDEDGDDEEPYDDDDDQ